MALYEHVFIARQDLSSSQAEELITKYFCPVCFLQHDPDIDQH